MSDELCERLDILIRLQAWAMVGNIESAKDKILFLSKAGLKPKAIAELLDTSTNHVNVTLSKERKGTGRD